MYFVMCIMYFVMCTMYVVMCPMYFVLCILYFVMCKIYFVKCKIYFVMCKILIKLLCQYCNRSCISINLSGSQNNSLCWPNWSSCRNVSRLYPVNSTLLLSWLLHMMCKLHDDDDDDESIVKTSTFVVASIGPHPLEIHCFKRRRHSVTNTFIHHL